MRGHLFTRVQTRGSRSLRPLLSSHVVEPDSIKGVNCDGCPDDTRGVSNVCQCSERVYVIKSLEYWICMLDMLDMYDNL